MKKFRFILFGLNTVFILLAVFNAASCRTRHLDGKSNNSSFSSNEGHDAFSKAQESTPIFSGELRAVANNPKEQYLIMYKSYSQSSFLDFEREEWRPILSETHEKLRESLKRNGLEDQQIRSALERHSKADARFDFCVPFWEVFSDRVKETQLTYLAFWAKVYAISLLSEKLEAKAQNNFVNEIKKSNGKPCSILKAIHSQFRNIYDAQYSWLLKSLSRGIFIIPSIYEPLFTNKDVTLSSIAPFAIAGIQTARLEGMRYGNGGFLTHDFDHIEGQLAAERDPPSFMTFVTVKLRQNSDTMVPKLSVQSEILEKIIDLRTLLLQELTSRFSAEKFLDDFGHVLHEKKEGHFRIYCTLLGSGPSNRKYLWDSSANPGRPSVKEFYKMYQISGELQAQVLSQAPWIRTSLNEMCRQFLSS